VKQGGSLQLASLASTPFKPFLVTTGNALALEGKFLQRGLQNPGGRFCHFCCVFCCLFWGFLGIRGR
jgi:hypothetical protein